MPKSPVFVVGSPRSGANMLANAKLSNCYSMPAKQTSHVIAGADCCVL